MKPTSMRRFFRSQSASVTVPTSWSAGVEIGERPVAPVAEVRRVAEDGQQVGVVGRADGAEADAGAV